jgi:hypothetical protein
MRFLLRMYGLSATSEAEGRRLLRILLLWVREMPVNSASVFYHPIQVITPTRTVKVVNC